MLYKWFNIHALANCIVTNEVIINVLVYTCVYVPHFIIITIAIAVN